jgi:DNA polymerase-3 subunit beta
MQFIAPRSDLNTVTQIAQRAISLRSPLPILSCLYFETSDNILTVTATDLEFGIRCTLPVTTLLEGSAALPAKYVTSLLNKLPDIDINVCCDVSNNNTSFTYGDSELVLNGYPADEFPRFPDLPQTPALKIKQNVFKRMLKRVLFAVSNDERRPIFTGVHIRLNEKGVLSMVATDTRKLAVCEENLEIPRDRLINVIVPGKTLNELYKLIDAVDDEFDLYLTENQIFFVIGNTCLMTRLIAGQYPDYQVVIPARYECEVKAPLNDLLEAAERASLLIDTKRNVFNISFQPQGLMIYFYTESGRIREELMADFSGNPIDVGFNVRLFIELLRSMDSENVIIKLSGRESPALFLPVDQESYFSLLVPAVA